jgi:hypothetical protein
VPIQQLAILDVVDDSTARYPDLEPVWGAAFAPKSRTLVVQLGHEAAIVTVDGQRVRPLALPAGMDIISRTAWSPDGTLIAVTDGHLMEFVDANGAGQDASGPLPYLIGTAGTRPSDPVRGPWPRGVQIGVLVLSRSPAWPSSWCPGSVGAGTDSASLPA